MIILQVNNVSKSFGAEPILTDIKLEVKMNEKVAIVGRNGVGKSTLLKLITGEFSHDSGNIIIPKDVTIGYLAQHSGIESEKSIWQEMIDVFLPLREMEKTLRAMESKMSDPNLLANETEYAKLLNEYDKLQVKFNERGGYRYEADIRSILHGLQFSNYDYENTPISTLSGGQKTRLALAKLLLTKPDLLILDEPTNHLDIETMTWLEQYLYSYRGAILIVSHDRYFLDKIVSIVYEISHNQVKRYIGNYSQYLIEKAQRLEAEMKEYEKQQAFIKKTEAFIQKNIARASTTKRAQSRRKQLEKLVRLEKPLTDEKTAAISFQHDRESGNIVLNMNDVSVTYNKKPVFNHVTLQITKGENVAIVGPNGVGKSSLLKAITKQIQSDGSIEFGANVAIGYYDQEQENVTSTKDVLHELWDDYPSMLEKDVRSVLGQFLFSGDDVFKNVSTLSGGETARLTLAKLMLQNANFLILDEPTNHLDLHSKEMLESALIDYEGTILFVSHDRYFINRLATKVVELSPDGVTEYIGDYDYYIEKKTELETIAEQIKRPFDENNEKITSQSKREKEKQFARLERKRLRRIEEVEETIETIEKEIEQYEATLAEPDVYENYEKASELNKLIFKKKDELEQLLNEWEHLHE
ncbi:ribosomal protection-like ABC-F family protein [Pueribacillus sp. YX66]|uniref:ribosomal protection-like ABC-F family protein n=1 Tax=Pueribacillus sp. YX66 TaxID=3229242 RepID=UPI00358D97C1